jgi:hypothetical protein
MHEFFDQIKDQGTVKIQYLPGALIRYIMSSVRAFHRVLLIELIRRMESMPYKLLRDDTI